MGKGTKKRLSIDFEGMDDIIAEYEAMGGRLEDAAEHALAATHQLVTHKLKVAIAPHYQTGETERSLTLDPYDTLTVNGGAAYVEVGFDIRSGGLASIFLMYGTPRMKPDTKLYNAIYGAATLREVSAKQAEVFEKMVMRRGRKK